MSMAYMFDNYIERLLRFITYHHGKRFTICIICTTFIYYSMTIYDYFLKKVYSPADYLYISHILIYVFLSWIMISCYYVRGDKRYVIE
ncbi:hypothetical protein ES702_01465 [subsurface metagenome]